LKTNFIIKESVRGFQSAKLSTIASIMTISLSLVLLAIFLTITFNSNKLIKSIKDKVEIEVFLGENISTTEVTQLKEKIKAIGGVRQIIFVSKEEAVKIFENEWGKDMLEFLESNPLPPSFRINLYDEYKSVDRINKIKSQLSSLTGITDVYFPKEYLEIIEKNSSGFLLINLVVLIIIAISSIFLVANTIRLVISSRSKIIETMRLIGATNRMIVAPYLIEGIIQGIIGSLIAIVCVYVLFFFFNSSFNQGDIKIELFGPENFISLVAFGTVLGTIGSVFSVNKYLRTKRNYKYA